MSVLKSLLALGVLFSALAAIKIGRYTIEHKTSNIKEAKCIESQRKLKETVDSTSFSLMSTVDTLVAKDSSEYPTVHSSTTSNTLTGFNPSFLFIILIECIL